MKIRNCSKTRTKVRIAPGARALSDHGSADHERTFLVDEKLEFRTGERDGVPTLVWRDPQGDVDEVFEFEAPETNAPTRAFFETCMYRAMFERKYRRGADGTRDEDLQEFIWQYVPRNVILYSPS
jgi:hypothetical protein